jgi:hypothetical protein
MVVDDVVSIFSFSLSVLVVKFIQLLDELSINSAAGVDRVNPSLSQNNYLKLVPVKKKIESVVVVNSDRRVARTGVDKKSSLDRSQSFKNGGIFQGPGPIQIWRIFPQEN